MLSAGKSDARFYDAHDQPTLGINGYASFARQFDARGNEIETAFFGLDGKPVQAGAGYAKVLYSYDTVGRETDARYFDAQGRQLAVDVVIAGVIPNTTAARLGFAPGDRIIDYDGRKPTSVKQFVDAVADASGHQLRRLVLRRGADDLKFEVAPGKLGVNLKIMLSELRQLCHEDRVHGRSPDRTELFRHCLEVQESG